MHLEILPSGSWRAIVKVNGKRRTLTRKTKTLAHQAGMALEIALGSTQATGDVVTVGDLVIRHLEKAAKRWSPTTHADFTRVAERLPEVFTDRPVSTITPGILAALYDQLEREGWTAHRVRRVHELLSVCWNDAMVFEWATQNPTRVVRPPTPEKADVAAPDHDKVRALLAAADGLFLTYLLVSTTTGARRGEIVALRWEDIDFDRAEISITHSLVQTTGAAVERRTKTGSKGYRRLHLPLRASAALRRWRVQQSEEAMANGLPAPRWIFSDTSGTTPWRPDRATAVFMKVRKRAGVTGVRLHDLRHWVATTMLERGDAEIDVSNQLGHASLSTLNMYAHYRSGRGRESADEREALLHRNS